MRHFLIWLTLLPGTMMAGNKIFVSDVNTLTAVVNGDWQNRPVMALGSDDVMQVGFDQMSHEARRYVVRVVRCEADWEECNELFESDWLVGLNSFTIDDYAHSVNTTVDYTHYQFQLPNEQCRVTKSGNYRLDIYDDEEDEQQLIGSVEFYVVEQIAQVQLSMTTNTDVDHNESHQQLAVDVQYGGLRVVMPGEEIRTVVMQNWHEPSARVNPQQPYRYSQGLRWEHCRELIFDGGNEYHKYETLDVSHPTMGIDRIEWDGHNYQAYPFASGIRRYYLTDESACGAFLVRNSDRTEEEYTCDYVWVNYRLNAPYDGDIWIDAQWTTNANDSLYRMSYDDEQHCYHASLLQKQGYYSYRYVDEARKTARSEGCFYQTHNRYQALVYYRATTDRTWRLVGYRALDCR